ncbi:MAG: hypothetical protein ABUS54_00085 [Actinomycetota bacterium]
MQDIAGARIILPSPVLQQQLLATLKEQYPSDDEFPLIRITDTREHGDRNGYRAVHVVQRIEGRPAEMQIRTPLQQEWAQLVERLDQRAGTDLKHGQGPAEWRSWLNELSQTFHRLERGELADLPDPPDFGDTTIWP